MSNKYVTNPPVKAMLYGGEAEDRMDTITIRISEGTINRLKLAAYVDRKNVSEMAETFIDKALISWRSDRVQNGSATLFGLAVGELSVYGEMKVGTGFIELLGDTNVYPVTRVKDDAGMITFVLSGDTQQRWTLAKEEYGATWRLWSWVPTETQRMAALWSVE